MPARLGTPALPGCRAMPALASRKRPLFRALAPGLAGLRQRIVVMDTRDPAASATRPSMKCERDTVISTVPTSSADQPALVLAHPGHELRLFGWIETEQPVVHVLTC